MLIRIETRAGHGGGKPTAKKIEEAADQWAFLVETLGVRLPETLARETRGSATSGVAAGGTQAAQSP